MTLSGHIVLPRMASRRPATARQKVRLTIGGRFDHYPRSKLFWTSMGFPIALVLSALLWVLIAAIIVG